LDFSQDLIIRPVLNTPRSIIKRRNGREAESGAESVISGQMMTGKIGHRPKVIMITKRKGTVTSAKCGAARIKR